MPELVDLLDSANQKFDPSGTTLTSTDAEAAIKEVDAKTGGGGSGDVVGPASAVDNNLATFNGTTGKVIQDGGVSPASFEPDLGNPTTDGFVLSSTIAGAREWIAPGGTDLSNAVFPDSAHFASEVAADATVAFTDSNKQSVDAAVNSNLTLTAPGVGNYLLKIVNSGSLAGISPTPLWDSGDAPVWAGTSVLSLYYDGTNWYGSAIVGAA